ncbi:hypothetical protein [Vibrio vulnificus]|uniref:Tail fiber protein n=1 Tax=Vibrio vulnificus TaxID=672 RepID=A0AAW4H4V1_VIBVL|nr:hypothetical protein [Vibrio vulnificus]MBN8120497.1 hypothetical protein [Vibrio vulnificus]
MSQELVNSVNKLTDETSALLQEYVKGNTVLQNSANEAASSAAAAKVSEGITIDKANVATQKAAEAKQFRDETAAVATGGTATLDPTPGKIPLANAEAKLHAGWLPVNVSALSEAIVEAIRGVNKEQYAASGFIHYGKHFNSGNLSSVNEGMTVDIGTPNVIYLGARDGVTGGNVGGASKTSYPVMNVAGFEVHLLGINSTLTNWQANTIKLPVEPNGTVVYDSSGNCRGTGKPTLDLSKEVDPKYGDVASSVNEAVARAFEGVIKNGNFRNGVYSGWTGQSATATLINNDAEVRVDGTGSSPINQALGSVPFSVDANTKYEVTFELTDSNNTASGIILANGLFDDTGLGYFYTNKAGKYTKTFTSNSAGTVQVRLHAGTVVGAYATFISHVSVKRLTEEVVINRVDMAGLEFFKRKVGEFLYPYGSPQCGYTEVDGIPTTEDTSRPITYFAAYDGDTTSRGRGWRLVDLTFAQLAVIMSNPKHNAWYNEEGELLQFGPRQRSFAGIGNGDWGNTNPSELGLLAYSQSSPVLRVIPQGDLDTGVPLGAASFYYYGDHSTNAMPETGAFSASTTGGKPATSAAVDGESYFYVLATVPRLNTAAYNNANFMGSCKFSDNKFWHNSAVPRVTIDDAFSNASTDKSASGREDGKKAQFIYQSGQGGVIDWRLPARDMSGKEEAAKVFQKVVNGTYLGVEKLTFTKVHGSEQGVSYQGNVSGMYKWNAVGVDFVINEGALGAQGAYSPVIGWLVQESKIFPVTYMFQATNSSITQIYCGQDTWSSIKPNGVVQDLVSNKPIYFVHNNETNISVSGNFTTLDVIGSLERILATPALANGCMGRWIPDWTPTAPSQPMTRKWVSGNIAKTHTSDLGGSWSNTANTGGDSVTNKANTYQNSDASLVQVLSYTAFAKQTKSSVNKSVLNGSEGVGDVYAMDRYTTFNGASFVESLIGKVPTSASQRTYAELMLQEATKTNESKLAFVTHTALTLDTPTNNSPAVKALWHQASNNRQATLNFLWNEMVFDTNWRTPDKVWSGGSVSVAAGETFRAESSSAYAVAGLLMRCVKALTANATVLGAMHVSVGGEVISLTDGQTYFKVVNNGWSDDSTIRIIDGVGTFNNENGDACLYGIDELAMPYGYTKNQAGVGKQVVGVDL